MIVDAHQHFWRLDRGDYGWLQPDLGALYRDYLPQHLVPLLQASDVAATVLVQAAASEAETRFLLEIAATQPFVAGVVGWVDFEAQDAPSRIASLVAEGGGRLKGLRPMIQDIADARWVLKPELDATFRAMINHDLAFDALVRPKHLGLLLERLRRHPHLRVVIDHCAKPEIGPGGIERWREDIAALAREPSVFCKLSGLLTEAPKHSKMAVLDPYVAHVFACFGPQRVMWGSDWPVLDLVADYSTWLGMARELVIQHAPGWEKNVFGANAIAFYHLVAASIPAGRGIQHKEASP